MTFLRSCLNTSVSRHYHPGDVLFDSAKMLKNTRIDIIPEPKAVVRVQSVSEVQAAVICAGHGGFEACARAGGHGFDNAAGCTGGV